MDPRHSGWRSSAVLLVLLLASGAPLLVGCHHLPVQLTTEQLEQRLHVSEKCTLMGDTEPSASCVAVRQALIGTSLSEADQLAISCFDALHAKKMKSARKSLDKGLVKEPTNPHLLACGKEIASRAK